MGLGCGQAGALEPAVERDFGDEDATADAGAGEGAGADGLVGGVASDAEECRGLLDGEYKVVLGLHGRGPPHGC